MTERRSSDRPNAMMFVDSNGSYHPPSPTARISSTKTQRLREEQLQLARMRQESQARFSKPRPALKLKVSGKFLLKTFAGKNERQVNNIIIL